MGKYEKQIGNTMISIELKCQVTVNAQGLLVLRSCLKVQLLCFLMFNG